MNCPCCSGKTYEECCAPFHRKEKHAPTAEALMRSRYSAYAIPNGEYLMETTHPGKRKFHNKADMQEWGEMNQWTKLEIVRTPALNHVEFNMSFPTFRRCTTAGIMYQGILWSNQNQTKVQK